MKKGLMQIQNEVYKGNKDSILETPFYSKDLSTRMFLTAKEREISLRRHEKSDTIQYCYTLNIMKIISY